jgi:hypothetical protein
VYGDLWLKRRDYAWISATYVTASMIAILILVISGNLLNDSSHVNRSAFMNNLKNINHLFAVNKNMIGYYSLLLLAPLLPLLAANLFLRPSKRQVMFIALSMGVLLSGRLGLDLVVYGTVKPLSWGHSIIPAVLFILLSIVTTSNVRVIVSDRRGTIRGPILVGAFVGSLVLSLYVDGIFALAPQYHANVIAHRSESNRYIDQEQLKKIRAKIPIAEKYEVILLPDFFISLFNDRSHVVFEWVKQEENVDTLASVNYIIEPKKMGFTYFPDHELYYETNDYLVYKRAW